MDKVMNELWHVYVGNDRAPWIVALARAIVGAVIIGGLGFLGMWTQTDDVKLLIISGLTPALTHLALRFGIEGVIDTGKKPE